MLLPTQHPAWISTCAELFATPEKLRIVTVGQDEEPAAIAPLVYTGPRADTLELVGVAQLHEPVDVVATDTSGLEALVDAIAELRRPLFFRRIPADAPSIAAIRRRFARRGLVVTRAAGECPFLPLDRRTEPDRAWTASMRADLSRAMRRAREHGPVTVKLLAPKPNELAPLLDAAFSIEAAGWKGRAGSAMAVSRKLGTFYRLYAERASACGLLRLAFLEIGGELAAMQLAVDDGEAYWLLKIGYDERFHRCSPGALLLADTMRSAARRGLRSYELLGGSAPWTRRWTQHERPNVSIRVFPANTWGVRALASTAASVAAAHARELAQARARSAVALLPTWAQSAACFGRDTQVSDG